MEDGRVIAVFHHLLMIENSLNTVKQIVLTQGKGIFAGAVVLGGKCHQIWVASAFAEKIFAGVASSGYRGAISEIGIVRPGNVGI